MRGARSTLAFGLVVVLFAGCLSPADDVASDAGDVSQTAWVGPAPKVDARATLDVLKAFSEAYPYRQAETPTHLAARDFLEAELAAAGLDTMRQPFSSGFGAVAAGGYTGENIIGVKWGEDRSRWVVVGAHYDITEGAVFGTYDDGSGTIMTTELAKAFASVNTTRTIAFILFDQEELGLVGSHVFVQAALDGTFEHNITVDAMIDLDMVGITWPHPAKLVAWENSPSLRNFSEEARMAVGVPDANVEYREPYNGVSDGASFIDAGIPTIYYWSDWDEYILPDGSEMPGTPLPYVGPYPWWHKLDTYETMMASAGDEATLQAGFQTVLDIVSPVLLRAASPLFEPDAAPVE